MSKSSPRFLAGVFLKERSWISMGIIEIGALASGLIAVITLTTKLVHLITSIQSLVNRLDQVQKDMTTTKDLWKETTEKYASLDQRLWLIEYELALV